MGSLRVLRTHSAGGGLRATQGQVGVHSGTKGTAPAVGGRLCGAERTGAAWHLGKVVLVCLNSRGWQGTRAAPLKGADSMAPETGLGIPCLVRGPYPQEQSGQESSW